MSLLHGDGHTAPGWLSGITKIFTGRGGGAVGDVPVPPSRGQFVMLEPYDVRPSAGAGRRLRDEVLMQWTRSGHLTAGEADELLALDESTRWYDRTC